MTTPPRESAPRKWLDRYRPGSEDRLSIRETTELSWRGGKSRVDNAKSTWCIFFPLVYAFEHSAEAYKRLDSVTGGNL